MFKINRETSKGERPTLLKSTSNVYKLLKDIFETPLRTFKQNVAYAMSHGLVVKEPIGRGFESWHRILDGI